MAEQQKQISLSEALEILKGNLDLLTASEIKQAKEVIDREGTPADKAYVNKLDTHFVNRVMSNKKEDNALTIEQLNLIPDMIGTSSLNNEEKLEALNKWRELSHETLKDIVSDKGETIEPTVYEDILELADKVYVNNADAKSKVVLTIERAKKLYDDENGLSNPKLNEYENFGSSLPKYTKSFSSNFPSLFTSSNILSPSLILSCIPIALPNK